jgi:hypothetical protein
MWRAQRIYLLFAFLICKTIFAAEATPQAVGYDVLQEMLEKMLKNACSKSRNHEEV